LAEYWKYIGKCLLPATLDSAISDEWEITLKAERARILSSLSTKIPDVSAFQDKVADASSDQYEAFLATVGAGWDADMIEVKQRVKLSASYAKWLTGITDAFAVGGTFEVNVTNKKAKLDELRRVIGVVGHKSLGSWNPASMVVLLMRGDTRPARYFDANDSFSGTLESVVDSAKGRYITPSILSALVQYCVLIKYANEGGLTAIRDTLITAGNTLIDALLQVALDATHLGTGYDFTIVMSWSAPDDNVIITAIDTHP